MLDDLVLGVFAKKPELGRTKTRLAADSSPAFARDVAEALLRDTLDRLRVLPGRRFLVHAPADETDWFVAAAGSDYTLEAQGEGDLGRRLEAFLGPRVQESRVLVVGTDSPTLPLAMIEQAAESLKEKEVVVVPATDGGYCLLGCTRRLPPIFTDMPWSGPDVLKESARRLQDAGFSLAVLSPWYDVDTMEDWRFLRGHVAALRAAGIDPMVPRTEKLLSRGSE